MKKTILLIIFLNCLISHAREDIFKYIKNIDFKIIGKEQGKDLGYRNDNMLNNGENIILKYFIKDTDTVFDVGANIGDWSSSVLQKGYKNIKVYAFEPIPHVYKNLLFNLSQYSDRIVPINLGLGNSKQTLKFYYLPNLSVLSSLYYRPVYEKFKQKVEEIDCNFSTIDLIVNKYNIEKINFLKIDTEGNEINILEGGVNSFKNRKIDIIQFEYGGCNLDSKTTLKEIYNFLSRMGFVMYRIYSEGLIYIDSWSEDLENYEYCNYLAVLK